MIQMYINYKTNDEATQKHNSSHQSEVLVANLPTRIRLSAAL